MPKNCADCSPSRRIPRRSTASSRADLVRSQSFEIIGEDKNAIVLRDASGFDVLLTVTCEDITEARTAAIDAARLAREQADDQPPGEIIDLHSR
jgi:hypothetical protein